MISFLHSAVLMLLMSIIFP